MTRFTPTECAAIEAAALILDLNINAQLATELRAMISTKIDPAGSTLKCTCPSGDGSLRWPCPRHLTGPNEAGGR